MKYKSDNQNVKKSSLIDYSNIYKVHDIAINNVLYNI